MSDVLRCRVVEADGVDLGRVTDIRARQDGPLVAGVSARIRVEGLYVGRGGMAERLGYVRGRVAGPWLVKALFSRLERRATFVPVETIEHWDVDAGVIRRRAR